MGNRLDLQIPEPMYRRALGRCTERPHVIFKLPCGDPCLFSGGHHKLDGLNTAQQFRWTPNIGRPYHCIVCGGHNLLERLKPAQLIARLAHIISLTEMNNSVTPISQMSPIL